MQILYCLLTILVAGIIGYLCGSIPNSVIIGKVFFHKDPRLEGSKNPGGTNTGRVLGIVPGIIVIILDTLKIMIPLLVSYYLFTSLDFFKDILFYSDEFNAFGRGNTISQLAYWIVPLFGVLGHCYSIFINFKGGKAVSSFLGFCLSSSWLSIFIFPLSFFSTIKINKHVSMASLISTAIFAIISWIIYIIYVCCGPEIANYLMYFGYGPEVCIYYPLFLSFAFVIVLFRHRSNIKDLYSGKERIAFWLKDDNEKHS